MRRGPSRRRGRTEPRTRRSRTLDRSGERPGSATAAGSAPTRGLDDCQVRDYRARYAHITLSRLAYR
ncbi:hypothetical protein E0F15_17560 [Frankia sp. B2]|nr:hypothetical protein E0F15_17560 [Frankia sp. B2]